MYSYSTSVCRNLRIKKKKKKRTIHKLKFPVSINYLVGLIFTLTALHTPYIYHFPLHLPDFHLPASFALKKSISWIGTE